MNNQNTETFYLKWCDPQSQKMRDAGVAFYNEEYGEYLLKIDEDQGKQLFLKAIHQDAEKTHYRMEMVIKRKNGKFLKRQEVGEGFCGAKTNGDVHIRYGSKYATLILCQSKGA